MIHSEASTSLFGLSTKIQVIAPAIVVARARFGGRNWLIAVAC